jgi:general stress protein YciG
LVATLFYFLVLREDTKMAGTVNGGKAAAATNKAKHGADFYAKIGAMGGQKGHTGGFYANRELARKAGAMGGRISRRTKKEV